MTDQPGEGVDADDTTEDDTAVVDPGPSPYADPDLDTDGAQDETP